MTKLHTCLISVGDIGPVHTYSSVGGSVSVRPYGTRLVNSVGFLVVSLTLLAPTILPLPLSWIPQALPNVWLWVFASVSISCWMKPL